MAMPSSDQPSPYYYAPLLPIAAAFTVGILDDRYFALSLPVLLALSAFGLIAALAIPRKSRGPNWWLLLALASLGAVHHHQQCRYISQSSITHLLSDQAILVRVRGILVEDWSVRPPSGQNPLLSQPKAESSVAILESRSIQKQSDWIPVDGRIRLTIPGRLGELRVGDEVELLGWANLPATPANPGEWDYTRWLRDQGIVAEIHVRKSQDLIVRLSVGEVSFDRLLAKIRSHGQEVLQKHLNDSEYGLSAALLLGLNNALPASEWEHFVRTGVIHVLAISGQHLVILGIFIQFLLRIFGIGYRRTAFIVALLLFIYAMLTGGRPSAMRAAIMVAAGCLGILIGRRAFPANTFALAWIGVLILNPGDLFSSGFQLSFLAVAVLIWGLPMAMPARQVDPLQQLIEENEPRLIRLSKFLLRELKRAYMTTGLISLALIPLIIQWQSLISISGLLIGPPVILLSTIALLAGFALFVDAFFGGFTAPFWILILKWSLRISNDMVQFADGLSWGCWHTGPLPMAAVVAFYAILIAWFIWSKWKEFPLPIRLAKLDNSLFLKALLASLLIGFIWPTRDYSKDELRIDFVSVGHGGCTILEFPDGRVLMYDAGSLAGPDIVQRHIAPFLWSRGIRKIDEVILSHADLDHFNGLPALIDRFAVGQVTTTPSFSDKNAPGVKEIDRVLEKRGIIHRTIHAPANWSAANVAFTVLHPPEAGPPGVENVRSLVLLIEHRGHRILLTGDIEKAGLEMILSKPIAKIDVLMSPHHGSNAANPTRLFDWAKPKLAVVNNTETGIGGFGGKIKANESLPTWSTGASGLITIRSHRTGLVAEAFRSGERKVIVSGGQ